MINIESFRKPPIARETLRATASSGKGFRNCNSKLNYLAKEVTDKLDFINDKKIKHLTKKQSVGIINTNNGEISIGTCLALSEQAFYLAKYSSVILTSIHGAHGRLGSEELIWSTQNTQ